MIKHVCHVRKHTNPDGTWEYELDAMVTYDPDRVLAELTLDRIRHGEHDTEYTAQISKLLNGMFMRRRYSPETETGTLVYDVPIELSKEEMNRIIRSKSVAEVKADMIKIASG